MKNTFRVLVEAVEENNEINDGKWSDWEGLFHIENVYGELDDEDVSHDEAADIFSRAIVSDGKSLVADLAAIQLRVQGDNFSGSWWFRS